MKTEKAIANRWSVWVSRSDHGPLDTETVVNSDWIRTRSPNGSVENETGKDGSLIGVRIGSLGVIAHRRSVLGSP